MDDPAFRTVTRGTFITTLITGLGTGVFKAFKGRPVALAASTSALDGGMVAATFFTVREYAVSPVLVSNLPWRQYETRRKIQKLRPQNIVTDTPLTWSELRMYNLLDTGISGALTGGFLNTCKRGRPGLVPGLCTGAFVCTLLQWTYNELSIARVKYVSRNRHSQVVPAVHGSSHPPPLPATSDHIPSEPTTPWTHKIYDLMGFRHISDDEHLVKLKALRAVYLQQMEVLEKEAEEKSREDSSESKDN